MQHLLVVLREHSPPRPWLDLALRFSPLASLSLRYLLSIPEGQSLSEGALPAQKLRDQFQSLKTDYPALQNIMVYVDYAPLRRALADLSELKPDLLLLDWAGPEETTGGLWTDAILAAATCDLLFLTGQGWQDPGEVFLSLRGGPNISLGIQAAQALSGGQGVTLFHAADTPTALPDLHLLQTEAGIQRLVTASRQIEKSLLREISGHKVVIMGASFAQSQPGQTLSGSALSLVYQQTDMALALIRAWHPETFRFHLPDFLQHPADEDPSVRVDRWFAENTFQSSEFADLAALVALKQAQGLSISVGLPALNEAATIGGIIESFQKHWMQQTPLIDELVLIDSDSTDDTVAIAQAYGIPVYKHPQLLPEAGAERGKGEALWKSLAVLKGDIIAWVDTDISNIHPRFVYGLVGPLLQYPHLQYVKSFYQRPLKLGDKLQAYGGGRVTELVVRPLLNLLYPELAGFVQPLSGQYAGRRAALEQMAFFSGYGVEIGLLIDFYERYGLEAIAQTDLEQLIHENQSLAGLSKMSFAILQVFINRFERRYGLSLLDKASPSLKLITHHPEHFQLETYVISDAERPAITSLPGYATHWAS
jgi:hypothetical protein